MPDAGCQNYLFCQLRRLGPFLSPPLHIHKVASTRVSIVVTLLEAELEVTKHLYLFFPVGPHRLKPSRLVPHLACWHMGRTDRNQFIVRLPELNLLL